MFTESPLEDQPEVLQRLAKILDGLAKKHNISLFVFAAQDGSAIVRCNGMTVATAEGMGEMIGAKDQKLGEAIMAGFFKNRFAEVPPDVSLPQEHTNTIH